MKPVDDTSGGMTLLDHLRQGGFTAAIIGMAGMVAKILLSNDEKMTWGKAARHTFAAGIVAWLVNQGLKEVAMAEGLKTASLGIAGAAAVHVVDFAIEFVKAQKEKHVGNVKGATRGRRTKR